MSTPRPAGSLGDELTNLGIGLLVAAVAPFERGKVRFQRPVLGSEEWVCVADSPIAAGERVKVIAVEGSFLTVGKI